MKNESGLDFLERAVNEIEPVIKKYKKRMVNAVMYLIAALQSIYGKADITMLIKPIITCVVNNFSPIRTKIAGTLEHHKDIGDLIKTRIAYLIFEKTYPDVIKILEEKEPVF